MGTIEEGGGHRICFYTDPPHRTGLWKFPKRKKMKKILPQDCFENCAEEEEKNMKQEVKSK